MLALKSRKSRKIWSFAISDYYCIAIAITGLYYFFNRDTLCDMKITELKRVSYSRIDKYHKNGIKPELHEEETAKLLT